MEYFALIRIALGLNFLGHALAKIGLGYLAGGEPLSSFLTNALRSPFVDVPYRAFLQGVVLPNAAVFAPLLVATELVVGLGPHPGPRHAPRGRRGPLPGPELLAERRRARRLGQPALVLGHRAGAAARRAGRRLGARPLAARPRAGLARRPAERLPLDRLHAVGPLAWTKLSGFATQFNYLALLRIMIGFTWLVAGTSKLVFEGVLTDPRRVQGQIELYGKQGYRDPLAQSWFDFVLANYPFFGPLVVAGELTPASCSSSAWVRASGRSSASG